MASPGVDVAERILAGALEHAEEAEVFHVASSSTPVRFEANRLKAVDSNQSAVVALRVIKDGRVGFATSSGLGNPGAIIGAALETAPYGARARFGFPGPLAYPGVLVADPAVERVSLETMAELGDRIVREVRARAADVNVEGAVSRSLSAVALVNSKGGRYRYEKTTFGVGFEGTVIRGDDMLFVHEGQSACSPITDVSETVASIIRQLEWARAIAPIESGTMPVIFMPSAVASILLFPLLAGLSGKAVLQGTSPLVGRLGERIADARFTLADDPTMAMVPGSRPADDEGVPSRPLALVQGGTAASFYYDLQTAGQAGTQSTGSGERAGGLLPSPGTGVLLVSPGDVSLEDMVRDVRDGLVVERLLGAGQSNILGGDFNANVLLGYRVKDGRVVGRVKNAMVSGNAYQALSNLIGIGSEARWLGGSLRTPAIACAGVSVAAKG